MSSVFQCVAHCSRYQDVSLAIAASGPYIHTFDVTSNRHVSIWPPIGKHHSNGMNGERSHSAHAQKSTRMTDSPPPKRPKLAPEVSAASSTEIIIDEPAKTSEQAPTVVRLLVSRDAKHLIAVTGEDKCIRVFEISPKGELLLMSAR